jgi:arsenate reductase
VNGLAGKKVLVLCTGNSCRSILAEALINGRLGNRGVRAESAGSRPAGRVHPCAEALLRQKGLWRPEYHSKTIEEAERSGPFDLVVTVCDGAKEACPTLPGTPSLHLPFEDPDGQPCEAFEATLAAIEARLLPAVESALTKRP